MRTGKIYNYNSVFGSVKIVVLKAIKRGGRMKDEYKENIIQLIQKVEEERFLRYLYILISEMTAKK